MKSKKWKEDLSFEDIQGIITTLKKGYNPNVKWPIDKQKLDMARRVVEEELKENKE